MQVRVFHVFYTPSEEVLLWGESLSGETPEKGRHPYASKPEALREAIGALFKNWQPAPVFEQTAIEAALPVAADGAPLPSRAFLSKALTTLPPVAGFDTFTVPALRIKGAPLFLLLQAAHRLDRFGRTLLPGTDLIRLAEIYRFAAMCLADGHFIPSLTLEGDAAFSRWRSVLTLPERERLAGLANRVPPVVFPAAADRTPARRLRLMHAFFEDLSDALVRVNAVTPLSRGHAAKSHFYSAHDAWLASLRSDSPQLRWPLETASPEQAQTDRAQLADLARTVARWQAPATDNALGATLQIELRPPPGETGEWHISASLPGAPEGALLTRTGLTLLGQASLLCPQLTPDRPLTPADAHTFIQSAAPVLRSAGFTVVLPPGLEQNDLDSPLELVAGAALKDPDQKAPFAPDTPVTITWQPRINGIAVSPAELQAIVDAASPIIYFHEQWITIDLSAAAEMLRHCRQAPEEDATLGATLRGAFSGGSAIHTGLIRSETVAEGPLRRFLATLTGAAVPDLPPLPAGLNAELRPYQLRGYAWLSHLAAWQFGACLADDMGLGKTLQTLAFLLACRQRGETRPALIVAPLSVLANWLHEIETFTPALRARLHHGAGRVIGNTFAETAAETHIVLTDYALVYRDFDALRRVPWSTLVLDEAQNIKNPSTRQSRAARALTADHRIALTGTPVENAPGDLWSIMDFLNPGLLGDYAAFRKRLPPAPTGTAIDPTAGKRLRRLTAPFILRRLKTDPAVIADLPEKTVNRIYCPLGAAQSQAYDTALRAFSADLSSLEGSSRRGRILAVLTRLKQICDHPALPGLTADQIDDAILQQVSGKISRLEDMLREVDANGESALIFTQFARMGALLRQRLAETFARDIPFLHGGLTAAARQREIDAFNQAALPSFFVLSLKAGGLGLNLTRASHVFHFDRWWNPAVENQATDRAHRIGQKRQVFVHTFICRGTLEDRIDALLLGKQHLADALVDANANTFLTRLPDDELIAMLQRTCEDE